ncbi:GtrA family protein [Clostridiisalibacter paucivorans]|uniref:GtrA family protein n=1 Tax=Clostridiisalibacter paucivorans TaxID=408753 RepID=UPI00055490EC|nr:GtrA family protein [Clostridiisalibacter paucivorans]
MKILINMLKENYTMQMLRYCIVGGATTVVSFGTYFFLLYVSNINPNIANVISIIVAILFAYVTNKIFVFKSHCKNIKELITEILSFFFARAITMLMEVGGVFFLIDLVHIDPILSKIFISIVILIFNYLLSRFFVYKERRAE